jgi:hypothetical protein
VVSETNRIRTLAPFPVMVGPVRKLTEETFEAGYPSAPETE